jgi:4-carboxymuconolactone decarboxylase
MTRLTEKPRSELAVEQQDLFDKLAAGRSGTPDGHIGGPFDAWVRSPEMGSRIAGLGNMFRFRTSCDRRNVEIVILVTGQFWRAQFEWWAHAPMALDAGVSQDVIDAIQDGRQPAFTRKDEEAAWRLAVELHNDHQISDETYASAVSHFGEPGVSELVNLAGYYTMVSMTLNAFTVPLPDGAEPPFK